MFQLGIQPNFYTYSLLIRTLCKRDVEVQKTIAMLQRKSARIGQKQNDIMLLKSENNLCKALSILYYALSDGVSIQYFEIDIFNQLLRVLSHYGNGVDAHYVYSQLNHPYARAKPNAATYAALINLFGRAGDIQMALHYYYIYSGIKHTLGPHDASYIYNALVDCHLKCGLLDEAFIVIERDMVEQGIELTSIPYNSIIRHYCMHNQLVEAKELILRMEETEQLTENVYIPHPDASSYGPLLSSYCRLNQFDDATLCYQSLIKTDISKAYGNLANYLLLCITHKERKLALNVAKDMTEADLHPDAILIQRIIQSHVEVNELYEAATILIDLCNKMDKKSLLKDAEHLIEAAYSVIEGDHQTTLPLLIVMQVAHRIMSLIDGGATTPLPPVNLSKIIVQYYHHNSNTEAQVSLTLPDYQLILCSSLVMSQMPATGTVNTTGFDQVSIQLIKDVKSEALWISLCEREEKEVIIYIDSDHDSDSEHMNTNLSLPDHRESDIGSPHLSHTSIIHNTTDHVQNTNKQNEHTEVIPVTLSLCQNKLLQHLQQILILYHQTQLKKSYSILHQCILQHSSLKSLDQVLGVIKTVPSPFILKFLTKSYAFIIVYVPFHGDSFSAFYDKDQRLIRSVNGELALTKQLGPSQTIYQCFVCLFT
ncbi:hypothetical protein BDB01DRAFT_28223 [Pilobolus umbonatus]|nr:hypothetical protein BDB01DRAFT_28223 [Pilobolus umbonatus]